MRYLSELLESVTVVEPGSIDRSDVAFGATVVVQNADGVRNTYQLVSVEEVDAKVGRVSIQSPIGKSLLGKSVGDTLVVKRPAGELELEVIEIKYV